MPNSKPKMPGHYPIHWHECLRYLAGRPQGGEVEIAGPLMPKELENTRRKLYAMRKSIRDRLFIGWSTGIQQMVCDDELFFEKRRDRLYAVRRPHVKRVNELLLRVLKK